MNSAQITPEEQLTLRDLLGALRRSRLLILLSTLTLGIVACAYALIMPKHYEATITVSVVTDEGAAGRLGGLGALASQYSGLASLAGISIGGGGNKRDETIAVLQSEYLTEKYIHDQDLLPVLFSGKWDSQRKSWKTSDQYAQPTLWLANRFFKKKVRKLTDEKRTGLVYLKIDWTDAVVAAKWANDLISLTNSYLRSKAIAESDRNIAYLREQVAKVEVLDERKTLYAIMEQEITKRMFAGGRDEYALKVLDPAVPSERPSSFGALASAMIGAAAGFVFAALWAIGRSLYLRES